MFTGPKRQKLTWINNILHLIQFNISETRHFQANVKWGQAATEKQILQHRSAASSRTVEVFSCFDDGTTGDRIALSCRL